MRGDIGGVRELIGDYIVNVLGVEDGNGRIKVTVEDVKQDNVNWKIIGYSWDEEKHAQVAELVKEGKLELSNAENGRFCNIRAITEADLKAVLP